MNSKALTLVIFNFDLTSVSSFQPCFITTLPKLYSFRLLLTPSFTLEDANNKNPRRENSDLSVACLIGLLFVCVETLFIKSVKVSLISKFVIVLFGRPFKEYYISLRSSNKNTKV